MARGDKADLFFRKLRSAGLSKPAVQTLAERLDALEAADSAASGVSMYVVPNNVTPTVYDPAWDNRHVTFQVTEAGVYFVLASEPASGATPAVNGDTAEIFIDPAGSTGIAGADGFVSATDSTAARTVSLTATLAVGDFITTGAPAANPSNGGSAVLIIGPAQPTPLAAFPT